MEKDMNSKISFRRLMPIVLAVVVFIGGFVVFSAGSNDDAVIDPSLPVVTVYKSATCGCCKRWVKHMKENGFEVKSHNVANVMPYKVKAKLGAGLGSCHTAFVDGYAIEGHVPAKDVKRLLKERPSISGLTVPAMPKGTPGMEIKGQVADSYKVISFKDGENVGVFSQY